MADPDTNQEKESRGPISKADVHLIVAIFLGSLIAVQAWDISDATAFQATWGSSPDGTESLSGIATGLFDTWAVPFEVLSVLLLVALVGAIAMAIKEGATGGGR